MIIIHTCESTVFESEREVVYLFSMTEE